MLSCLNASMGRTVNLTLFSLLAIFISIFFPFSESFNNTITEFFLYFFSKLDCKNIILLYSPIHCGPSLWSMMTSAFHTWKCEKGSF